MMQRDHHPATKSLKCKPQGIHVDLPICGTKTKSHAARPARTTSARPDVKVHRDTAQNGAAEATPLAPRGTVSPERVEPSKWFFGRLQDMEMKQGLTPSHLGFFLKTN